MFQKRVPETECSQDILYTPRSFIFDDLWILPGSILNILDDSWLRFLYLIVVVTRSATHMAESAKTNCQESAPNRQESPTVPTINDGTDTL